MNKHWDKKHGTILMDLIKELDKNQVRYFILRNYEGLPETNQSKDVDIIVEPSKVKVANTILTSIYKQHGLSHLYMIRFTDVYCWHGMDIEQHLSIHIDIIGGYRVKGCEVFTFDELYEHTSEYKGFKVVDPLYEGVMVFVYKQFGYKTPKLKEEYKQVISKTNQLYPEIASILQRILGDKLAQVELEFIVQGDYDKLLSKHKKLTQQLRHYALKKAPLSCLIHTMKFYALKLCRLVLCRHRYVKSFSVMAPDGAGKTTFLNSLVEEMAFYFTKDTNCGHIYHFRPTILPNLGEIGEKVGIMEQDTNYSVPHRAKPVGIMSSFTRITYYWIDYILGWFIVTTKDILRDRFTIFDRYAYDLIVDPGRTRLNLPIWIRKKFVKFMPEPRLSFYIKVDPEEIYRRKQELQLDEIKRQVSDYEKLVSTNKRILPIDGNRPVQEMVNDAIKMILDQLTIKLK